MDLIGNVKGLFKSSDKPRHDSTCDQYSRRIMFQVMIMSGVLVGMNWFSDDINCIVPDSNALSSGFVSQACWINGFYVYAELEHTANNLGYYGIPNNIEHDGHYPENGKYCSTVDQDGKPDIECVPLTKTFFLQYQWYLFFLTACSIFYYIPYLIYKQSNNDIKTLFAAAEKNEADEIYKYYFDPESKKTKSKKQTVYVAGSLAARVGYIVANCAVFSLINKTLYGKFASYGEKWMAWTKLPTSTMYDYIGDRKLSKPGDPMLPTFGMCSVLEAARDERHTILNQHKFICEYSTHVLYHYLLILMFYLLIIGIILSCLGFIQLLAIYVSVTIPREADNRVNKIRRQLTLRENEYLYVLKKSYPEVREKVIQNMLPLEDLDDRVQPSAPSPITSRDNKPLLYPDLRKRNNDVAEEKV